MNQHHWIHLQMFVPILSIFYYKFKYFKVLPGSMGMARGINKIMEDNIRDWCKSNLMGHWFMTFGYVFIRSKYDAMTFKMVWSELE